MKTNGTPKKLLLFSINFVWLLLIYKLILFFADRFNYLIYYIGISVYLVAAAALFCIFYAMRGFTLNVKPTNPNELPDEWSPVKKAEYLSHESHRRERADKILYFLLPMVLTIIINYIELFLPTFLNGIF